MLLRLLRSLLTVNSLSGRPARNRHWLILNPGRAVGIAPNQRMRKELFVVPARVIRPLMGSTRFSSMQRALHDRFRHIEHETELQGGFQFSVKRATAVVEIDVSVSLLQVSQLRCPLRKKRVLTIDPRTFFYRGLHLVTDGGNSLPTAVLVEELRFEPLAFVVSLGQGLSIRRGLPRRVKGRGPAGARPKHQTLRKRVGS